MNNRPHKKEKAKKRSKKYSVEKALYAIHHAGAIIHYGTSRIAADSSPVRTFIPECLAYVKRNFHHKQNKQNINRFYDIRRPPRIFKKEAS